MTGCETVTDRLAEYQHRAQLLRLYVEDFDTFAGLDAPPDVRVLNTPPMRNVVHASTHLHNALSALDAAIKTFAENGK